MLFAVNGPVVLVSNYGIRDLRIANEFILWDSADGHLARLRASAAQKFVAAEDHAGAGARLFCDGTARCMPGGEPDGGPGRHRHPLERLDTDFGALLAACRATIMPRREARERPAPRGTEAKADRRRAS